MKKRASPGFTLIELLVATAVTAIIVGLMITMVNNLLTAYNRSSGALAAQSQAGFVLDQLATEVESMVLRNTDDVMLAATIRHGADAPSGFEWSESDKPSGNDSLVVQSVSGAARFDALDPIESQRFGQGGVFLRYFTSAPSLTDDDDEGVRAVGYRLELDGVTSATDAPLQYMLYRGEIPARATFEAGYDLDPDAGDYTEDEVGTTDSAPNTLLDPTEANIIAGNVVDFGVRFFEISEAPANFKQRGLLFPLDSSDVEYLAAGSGAEEYPRAIEVMLRILTPEGERLLEALREGNLTGRTWWEIVDQNSEVFSRVINIPSRPL